MLEKELRRLDKYEALIIDDLGYVQQNREEMEVLFDQDRLCVTSTRFETFALWNHGERWPSDIPL